MSNVAIAGTVETHSALRAASVLSKSAPRWSRQIASDLLAAAEAGAVVLGCLLPAVIYARAGEVAVNWIAIVQVGIVAAIIVRLCLKAWGMYDTMRMEAFPSQPQRQFAALMIACVAILGLGLPMPARQPHVTIWYATWIMLSFTLMLVLRSLAVAQFARMTKAGLFDVRIAVFGAGAVARRVRDHLVSSNSGVYFVGAFDDRTEVGRLNPEGVAVAGSLDDLVALGRIEGVDRIIVALPASANDRIEYVSRKLEQLPVSLHVVTHIISDLIVSPPAHKVSTLGSIGLLDVKRAPLADWAPYVKRTEDIVLGSLFLLVSLPLFLLVAIAIKLESRGPVFFVQRRRGLNQRIIAVLKFRTMRVMEDGAVLKQATKDDPRVTAVGKLLRRSSLDELPQLINVLRGDMSLVGPRPHAIAHDDLYGGVLVGYVNRHQVKPGITGLAQVRGLRGETRTDDKIQRRIETDLEYITAWSPRLDLKILARTVVAVIKRSNAY